MAVTAPRPPTTATVLLSLKYSMPAEPFWLRAAVTADMAADIVIQMSRSE